MSNTGQRKHNLHSGSSMCKGPGVERGLGMFVKLSVPSDWSLTQTLLNLSFP